MTETYFPFIKLAPTNEENNTNIKFSIFITNLNKRYLEGQKTFLQIQIYFSTKKV